MDLFRHFPQFLSRVVSTVQTPPPSTLQYFLSYKPNIKTHQIEKNYVLLFSKLNYQVTAPTSGSPLVSEPNAQKWPPPTRVTSAPGAL